jgi:antitoxin component YwqK of YwqJK toxin-antitoxin module
MKEEGYFHNGNKSYEKNYKNGDLNGKYIIYDSEGLTSIEQIYKDNRPINSIELPDVIYNNKKRCCIIS